MLAFDRARLQQQLARLDPESRLLFAVVCCERLLPGYRHFFQVERWGNPAVLRAALDLIWFRVGGGLPSEEEVAALIAECEAASPHTNAFGPTASDALDAATAITTTLAGCLDPEPRHLASVGAIALDAAEADVPDPPLPSSPEYDHFVASHPVVQAELQRQQAVIAFLSNHCRHPGQNDHSLGSS